MAAVVVLSVLSFAATPASARETYNISSGWTFFTSDASSTDDAPIVNLPHIQTTTGTVNYLKDIDIPTSWEGRRVFLRIGGASRTADIFVGGIHTATHPGSGSSFTVEITPHLRWGAPASVRIVVNSSPSLDVLPTAGGEKIYGGIFRGVELIVCEPFSISPTALLPASSPQTSTAGGRNTLEVTTTPGTPNKGSSTPTAGGRNTLEVQATPGTPNKGSSTPTAGGSNTLEVQATPGTPNKGSSTPTLRSCEGNDGLWITTDRLTAERAEGRVRLALLLPASPTLSGATPAATTSPATTSPAASPATTPPAGATARIRITDAEGNTVARNTLPVTSSTLEIPFTVSTPRLWQGTADPYLYNVEVTLTGSDGIRTDSLAIQTGFRKVGIDADNNLTLNGIPTKIHGVTLSRDRMLVGTALTPFQIEEDIDFIREMGANAVRVVGGPHSDYFYRLCNEAGLLVWNDGPFTGAAYPTDIDFVDTEAFRTSGRTQFREMISGLYNHPSVVAWGIFSNVSMRTGDPVPYIRELNALAHNLDPQRLTAAGSVQDGDMNFITDLVSFDLALGWESGLPDGVVPWLRQLRRGWPDLRAGISFGAGASIFHQSERLERPSSTDSYHPEGWQTFFHEQYIRNAVDAPGLWGVFVVSMFDSGAAKASSKATGVTSAASPTGFPGSDIGAIDDRGLVTFDRKDRKDAFWLYKAIWNRTDPFVHIAGSRLDSRTDRRQTIRAYSNLTEVELFIDGRSLGRRTGERGIFVWEGVEMRTGVNRLEARASGAIGTSGTSTSSTSTSGISGTSTSGSSGTAATSAAATSAGASATPPTSATATTRTTITIYPSAAP